MSNAVTDSNWVSTSARSIEWVAFFYSCYGVVIIINVCSGRVYEG